MKFPNLVYKSPGTHQCPGGTFGYLQVKDHDELLAAVKMGYCPTVTLAVETPDDFDWATYAEEQGWTVVTSPKTSSEDLPKGPQEDPPEDEPEPSNPWAKL